MKKRSMTCPSDLISRTNHRRLRHRRAAGIIVSIAFFGCFLPENLVNWNIFITFAA